MQPLIQKFIPYVALVIVLVFFGYRLLGTEEVPGPLIEERALVSDTVGREFVVLLESLKKLEIDYTFFGSEAFKHLEDFSEEIAVQPVGRANPFAPI